MESWQGRNCSVLRAVRRCEGISLAALAVRHAFIEEISNELSGLP